MTTTTAPSTENFYASKITSGPLRGQIGIYSQHTGKKINMSAIADWDAAAAYIEREEERLAARRAKAAAEAEQHAAAKAKADAEGKAAATRGPLATERQVSYIMQLLAQTDGGQGSWYSGPTTLEGVRAMTRSAASTYISALKGE